MVKICCIGAGYVGGPTMAVIALKCPDIEVAVVDISASIIAAWNSDHLPIYEPGLHHIVNQCRTLHNNLLFSTDVHRHVADADIVFISVNTPTKTTGLGTGSAADLSHWESAARTIAAVSTSDKIVVEKSTVPVRTAEALERILAHTGGGAAFQVVSNPEFLAEGTAVRDLLEPDRVLLGGRETPAGQAAVRALEAVYSRWVPRERILSSSLWSAELAKLAANAFLAQRISSVNALAAVCEATGADVGEVARAVGRDTRVGPRFLEASVGFGGWGLRKDVESLAYMCEGRGLREVAEYWRRVVEVNEYQKGRFVRRVVSAMFNTVWGKRIAVLGMAFKKDTADTRESPALDVCRGLLRDGAVLSVYDPRVTREQIRTDLAHSEARVSVADDAYQATRGAHGVCILTEWDQFKSLDYERVFEGMQKPAFVFDGRNVVDVHSLRQIGFIVYSIGKPLDPWLKGMP